MKEFIILCIVILTLTFLGLWRVKAKGFLISPEYLHATRNERKTMDKKQHMCKSGLVLLSVAAQFLLMAISFLSDMLWWLGLIALIWLVATLFYASSKVMLIIISSTLVLTICIFIIPSWIAGREYDRADYKTITYVDDENGDYIIYGGKEYYPHDSGNKNVKYPLHLDRSNVTLTTISWSYGFPFASVMSYSSYTKSEPLYITADWIGLVYYAGEIEKETFYINGVDAELYPNELHSDKNDIDLSTQKAVCRFELIHSSLFELSLYASVYYHNADCYISFDGGSHAYEMTDSFNRLLTENNMLE